MKKERKEGKGKGGKGGERKVNFIGVEKGKER